MAPATLKFPPVGARIAAEVAGKLFRNQSEKLPVEGLAPVFGVEPLGVEPCRAISAPTTKKAPTILTFPPKSMPLKS
jgi:hypothetical protein